MRQLPAPETIFGRQELTQEDTDAQGSRFRDVKAAIFANPYQTVWGDPNAPPLPHYQTTKKSVYAGSFPGGRPQFKLARSERWIPPLISVGEKMARLSKTGAPQRRLRHRRLGHHRRQPLFRLFQTSSQGLVIARISAGVTMTLRGIRRSYGIALKLYPTVDDNHDQLLQTANVFLVDDLGGTTASHLIEVELTNAPHVTGFNRGHEIPVLLKEGLVFALVDRMATIRQVYPIAELGQAAHAQTNAPAFLRLQAASGQPVIDEQDVRHEVLAHIFDK